MRAWFGGCVLLLLCSVATCFSAAGDIDTTFGQGGKISFGLASSADQALGVAVQPDGKVVIIAQYEGDFLIGRFLTNGIRDTSFGDSGWVSIDFGHKNDIPVAVRLDTLNRVTVLGRSGTNIALARLTIDGRLDASFDGDGRVLAPGPHDRALARDFVIQSDGRLVVGALLEYYSYTGSSSYSGYMLARFNSDGSLDPSFDDDGILAVSDSDYWNLPSHLMVALQGDGKIVVAYDPTVYGDATVMRFHSDGSVDSSFANDGEVLITTDYERDYPRGLFVQPDGRIVVCTTNYGGGFRVYHLTASGVMDGDASVPLGSLKNGAVAQMQGDGRIIIAGALSSSNAVVARLTAAGALDNTFSDNGWVTITDLSNATVTSVALSSENRVIVTGSEDYDFLLMRFTSVGALDTTLGTSGQVVVPYAGDDEAFALAWDPIDEAFRIAGAAGRDFGLASVTPDGRGVGKRTLRFHQAFSGQARGIAFDARRNWKLGVIAAGTGDGGFALARGDWNGWAFAEDADTTTPFGSRPAFGNGVAILPDGMIIVAGGADPTGAGLDFALARYTNSWGAILPIDPSFSGDGKLTTSFNTAGDDEATCVIVQSDGKIVAGGYTWNGANFDFAVARYLPNGALDNTFSGDGKVTTSFGAADAFMNALTLQPDGKIVAAGAVGADFGVARYLPNGALDATFNADGKTTVSIGATDVATSVAVGAHGKIIVGGWTTTGGNVALAVLNTDGSMDTTFSGDGRTTYNLGSASDRCNALLLQSDGKIVVAGGRHNGSDRDMAMARFHGVVGPTISFSSNSYTINEDALSYSIHVVLGAPSTETISAYFLVNGGTATSFSDYTVANQTVTFAPGETNKTITFALKNDTLDEPTETVSCALISLKNASPGANLLATLNITDQDPAPAARTSIGNILVDEGAGSVTLTIFLGQSSAKTSSVSFATSNGLAVEGADYRATNGIVTFLPGQTSRTVTLSILDDGHGEIIEGFNFTLSNPTNAVLGSPSSTLVRIRDNDPLFNFSSSGYTVLEAGVAIDVAVTLSAAAAVTSQVTFATSPGTAAAGVDYASTNGTLVFLPGQTNQTFRVRILNDASIETNETVQLSLINPQGLLLGSISNATLTILDTSALPTVQFGSSNVLRSDGAIWVYEGTSPAIMHVTLSRASTQTVTVGYSALNGTAVAGADFTSASGSISFAPGQTNRTFSVSLLNNATPEDEETFRVILGSPVNAVLGAPTNHTLRIIDNDATYLSVTPSAISVDEDATNAVVNVTLSAASDATVTVEYTITNLTAVATKDYLAMSGRLTFNPGETNKSFTVPLIDDLTSESNETLRVVLSAADNATLLFSTGTITIVDDEPLPTVAFTVATNAAQESVGNIDLEVALDSASDRAVFVRVISSSGTASATADYGATTVLLMFAPGQTTHTISVPVVADNVYETNESFLLLLVDLTNAAPGVITNAVVVIQNTTALPTIAVAAPEQAVSEVATNNPINVTLSHPAAIPVSLQFATVSASAAPGLDYVSTNGLLVFAPGQTNLGFHLRILADTAVETNETLAIELSGATNAIITGGAIVTIIDNDLPRISLAAQSNIVTEAETIVLVTVTRPESGMTSIVTFATSSGTATDGDYVSTNGSLTFLPGETNRAVVVRIREDAMDEPEEFLDVDLTGATGGLIGRPSSSRVVIVDNDPPRIALRSAQYPVSESSGAAAIEVFLSSAHNTTVFVDYATSNGTAIVGADYVAATGTLVFAPGQTNKTFLVTLLDDSLIETNETLSVTLSGFSGGTPGALTTGTLFISDDDFAQLSIRLDSGSAFISWTNSAVGFTLQSVASVPGGAQWVDVQAPIAESNGFRSVLVPSSSNSQFYRLRR